MKIREVSISEYKAVFIAEDGTAHADGWTTGIGAKVIPYSGGHKFIAANGGLYNTLLLEQSGDVYVNTPSSPNLTFLQMDDQGKHFKAIAVECQMRTYFAIRDDGSIWAQGYNSYKYFGSDSNKVSKTWSKIPGQPDLRFKSIVKGVQLLALTDDGQVYMLADSSSKWTKKELPGKAERIVANGNGTYIALIDGRPYGWGQSRYLTGVTGTINGYEALADNWGLQGTIIDIGINDNAVHFISSDNKLYGFGDNAQGEVGVGWELVNQANYKGTRYVWNWVNAMQNNYQDEAFVSKPVPVRPEIKFARIFAGGTYSYYRYAMDVDGKLYSWGRNKAVVLGNGRAVSNESVYPNALDVTEPTEVNPFDYVIPMPQEFKPGIINAGVDQSVDSDRTTLRGTVVPSGSKSFSYKVIGYNWRKVSGPDCTIASPTELSTDITGLSNGTYAFELKVTDEQGGTMTDTVTVNVEIMNNKPSVEITCNKVVIDDHILLVGKASDSDGKVVLQEWSKVSGPSGDSIEPIDNITNVSFGAPGEYTYRFTATDDKGAIGSIDINLIVYAAGSSYIIIRK